MSTSNPETSSPALLDRISAGSAFVAGLAVLAITVIITFDVLMRYFFNEPQQFADELASFLLVLAIFGGLAHTYQRDGHIRVDLLTNRLGPKSGRALKVLALLVGVSFMAVITWNTLMSSIVAYRLERTSMVLFYPLWIPMLLIPLGTGLMALVMVIALVGEVRGGIQKGMESGEDAGKGSP